MTDERDLTAAERDALRALAANVPADAEEEELTVRRLRASRLLGAAPRAYATWPRALRVSVAAAAAIVCYLAGVYSGRVFRSTAPAVRTPTTETPHTGADQASTVAARPAGEGTTIIRF